MGWDVRALDLLGHGDRNVLSEGETTVDDLALDVAAQAPGPVDVIAGHSLGGIVGLTLAGLQSGYCRGVVIEDPPGLAGALDPRKVADSVRASVQAARGNPAEVTAELLNSNPLWSATDARHAVISRQKLNDQQVTRLLDSADWDLQQLVRECPVPVALLAADSDSALLDPDRSALMDMLPSGRTAIVRSGHSIHRDRPALWLQHVLDFAGRLECGPSPAEPQ